MHILRTPRRGRGFTLIELLVTVGIIVILIAILLPVLTLARAQANTARCLGNQRQLMQACISYAVDNDGYLPPPNWDGGTKSNASPKGWLYDPSLLSASNTFQQTDAENGALYPYLSNGGQPLGTGQVPSPNALQVFRCYIDGGTYSNTDVQVITSYMMNGAVCDYSNVGDPPEKLRAFKSNAILLWEIPASAPNDAGQVNDGADWPAEEITTRHQNGSTVGFVDGHAEQMTWTAFTNEWFNNAPGMLWCAPGFEDGGQAFAKQHYSGYPSSPPPQPAGGG